MSIGDTDASRVTARALFRQAIFTVETQGALSREQVLEAAQSIIDDERRIDAEKGVRAN
jgi:hypothetical protein